MITSGITRKIDELGRIVLPKEIRKSLNINTGDDFQITIENNRIILNKFEKLKNIETEILKIIKSFILVYPYKIYFIIGNEEITTKETILQNLVSIIQERKIYYQENIEKVQIFENKIEEVTKVIDEAFAKINPVGPSDMGKIMGMVTPILKGKADMSLVNAIIKEKLANL